jgi:hypothetical protein
MNLKILCPIVIALLASAPAAKADVNIRKVSYVNLPALEAQPTLTPASNPDCNGPDPFANADWKNTGLAGGCATGRIPALWFNIGQKVPAFEGAVSAKPIDVAILTLDEINSMRALNPGATFRMEVKAMGTWTKGVDKFTPIGLYPGSMCVSRDRYTEIQRLYGERGLDWSNKWWKARRKFAFGGPDYKAFESTVDGPHGFNLYYFYDFDMDECDVPLALEFQSRNIAQIKFDILEVNVYVCSSKSACNEIADLF